MHWFSFLFVLPIFTWGASFCEKEVMEWPLDRKIGQLLMVHFNGHVANEEAEKLIRLAHVGGFIYYEWSNGLVSQPQVRQLSQSLQEMAQRLKEPLPLLIAIDQEGGRVNRAKYGFTTFPGNGALGVIGQASYAFDSAEAIGKELKAAGIGLNLAPVLDLLQNKVNPVIGSRSFGSEKELVATLGCAAVQGLIAGGVACCTKHFPGHGGALIDSHISLPTIQQSKESLCQEALFPFMKALASTPVMMTAHLFIPALDPNHPVTLSSSIVNGMLRDQLKYEGVICTDSLAMAGILEVEPSLEKLCLGALLAGHDLILLGGKQLGEGQKGFELSVDRCIQIHHYLVEACQKGRLSEELVNRSLCRMLKLKEQFQVGHATPLLSDKEMAAHAALSCSIMIQAAALTEESRDKK